MMARLLSPKISVIVPVCNTEKYISKCIESVITQTFNDFELLLINDGSYDNSGLICDNYASNDKRIRVWHNISQGTSSTRRFGINNAQGKYLFFLDSDDFLDQQAFEKLYTKLISGKFDIVIGNMTVIRKGNNIIKFRISLLVLKNKTWFPPC